MLDVVINPHSAETGLVGRTATRVPSVIAPEDAVTLSADTARGEGARA